MNRKVLAFLVFLVLLLCSCSAIRESGIALVPTADIEKTVHWMVDDAVMAASTQLVYELRKEIRTMIPPTLTPTKTYVVPIESTPTMTSIWQGQHRHVEETPTGTPDNCINRVKFVEDITIPDGTVVEPGKPFTKTWKLQNVGTCIWTEQYQFEFVDGNIMNAKGIVNFPKDSLVRPNDTMLISVYMTAPVERGKYQSNWKIRSPYGQQFGTGENGENPVWVKVEVR